MGRPVPDETTKRVNFWAMGGLWPQSWVHDALHPPKAADYCTDLACANLICVTSNCWIWRILWCVTSETLCITSYVLFSVLFFLFSHTFFLNKCSLISWWVMRHNMYITFFNITYVRSIFHLGYCYWLLLLNLTPLLVWISYYKSWFNKDLFYFSNEVLVGGFWIENMDFNNMQITFLMAPFVRHQLDGKCHRKLFKRPL